GIDELSMNPQSIPAVKSIIRSMKLKDARLFIKDVLKKSSSTEIVQLVQDTYGDILPDKLYYEG
ncbi:MAG: hypothetical protein U9Q38_03040, partial [Thermodesulfobacteriota bacterium]|nr:hypothetical protein [Thermodesulfobacteriota bacterium]